MFLTRRGRGKGGRLCPLFYSRVSQFGAGGGGQVFCVLGRSGERLDKQDGMALTCNWDTPLQVPSSRDAKWYADQKARSMLQAI